MYNSWKYEIIKKIWKHQTFNIQKQCLHDIYVTYQVHLILKSSKHFLISFYNRTMSLGNLFAIHLKNNLRIWPIIINNLNHLNRTLCIFFKFQVNLINAEQVFIGGISAGSTRISIWFAGVFTMIVYFSKVRNVASKSGNP